MNFIEKALLRPPRAHIQRRPNQFRFRACRHCGRPFEGGTKKRFLCQDCGRRGGHGFYERQWRALLYIVAQITVNTRPNPLPYERLSSILFGSTLILPITRWPSITEPPPRALLAGWSLRFQTRHDSGYTYTKACSQEEYEAFE